MLYANNVRQYMLKYSKLTPSESTYNDMLAYQQVAEAAFQQEYRR